MNILKELMPFGDVLGKVFDRVFPNPEDKAKAQLEVLKMQQAGEFRSQDSLDSSDKNQAAINAVEAESDSLFKSGWRPAAGWMAVFGLGYQVIIRPTLEWIGTNLWAWDAPPSLEIESLMTLLFGLLGLGAYRTFEKTKR